MAQVKNWGEFQHYKDRCPPWIKLQKSLLDDYEFACLPIASKALAPFIWLLASETKEGVFDASLVKLAFRLRWPISDVAAGLKPLIEQGFITDASEALAECLQLAVPETEGEGEKDKSKSKIKSPPTADLKADLFDSWKALPGSGGGAFLVKLLRDNKPEQRVLEAVQATLEETRADPKAYVQAILLRKPNPDDPLENAARAAERVCAQWDADPDSAPWAGAL